MRYILIDLDSIKHVAANRCFKRSGEVRIRIMSNDGPKYSEGQARRAVKKVGLVAKKFRWRKDSPDNMGEFQIIDPTRNFVVDGFRYDCTPDDVVALCEKIAKRLP
jgi:hypothetical protein